MPRASKSTSAVAGAPREGHVRGPRAQRGQILLLALVLLTATGLGLFVSGASNEVNRALNADVRTRSVLEQARDALTSYATAHPTHPGSLPCPDTNDDGLADGSSTCAGYVGRLPWRTLGVGDLRDESGERLWYALSPNFRDDVSVQINSDSRGDRTVFSGSAATIVTTEAAAVVLAPGTPVPGQLRDAIVANCAATGANLRRDLCPSNYLERDGAATPAWSNASATGPYMRERPSTTFNDKLLVLRNTDFIPLVERRAAGDLLDMTLQYRRQSQLTGGCQCYPWPDRNGDGSSDADNNRGRFPIGGGRAIAGITQGLPGVVTTSAPHGFSTGQSIYLTDIAGMTQLNGTITTVTKIDDVRFSIGVSTLLYSAYTAGGRALPSALPHSWFRSISAISRANPGVVTTTAPHGFSPGQRIALSGIAGMTELNDTLVTVTPIDATRFSIAVNTSSYGAYTSGGTTAPAPLAYLERNNWTNVIYYTVAKASLENGALTCTNCILLGPLTLSVNGTDGYGIVLITPGAAAPGQTRTSWAHYLDDAQNRDANPQPAGGGAAADPAANDAYVVPPGTCPSGQCPTNVSGIMRCVASTASCPRNVTAPARDRLFLLTAPAAYAGCSAAATMLLKGAPCHTTGTAVKAICQEAANILQTALCTCSVAAVAMITPPCRNTLNPGACQAAVASLKSCASIL
jgi:hypothetical protein